MIIYICPKCNDEMVLSFTHKDPIIHFLYCAHCGYTVEEIDHCIKVVPFTTYI